MVYYIVSSYQNKQGDIFLNATATNDLGLNSSTNRVEILSAPINYGNLGEALAKMFQDCIRHPHWTEEVDGSVEEVLGIKPYSKFRKLHLNVIIIMDQEKNIYTLKPTIRKNNGYVSEGKDYIILSTDSNYDSLGEAVIKAFQSAR
ncbi:hypothetical protein [Paenibacillus donghaensis]|uniref:DUF1436 family protein n=1 Tax=Paenibacillus donghaensis TaxID=414771 RepID=A0A2Z2KRH5_9BACL|nr:hypothetical protein [Paenibacillus donghaensis]ASA23031.1 hypothetical protein B9T62_20800 [Paenibacillus donghaensis]